MKWDRIAARNTSEKRFIYWFEGDEFDAAKASLMTHGYELRAAPLTPCQTLRASGRTLVYAPPKRWSGFCKRQGSWYRDSRRRGQWLLVSDHRLPAAYESALDSITAPSEHAPSSGVSEVELHELVEAPIYQFGQPRDWESVTRLDAFFMRLFFRVRGVWKRGETFRWHWLGQRANHANFLTRRFTTRIDGEDVAHSVTGNESVCSSCVQFFNVMTPEHRKLVRACPGAILFAGAQRDVYYDVRPVALTVSAPSPSTATRRSSQPRSLQAAGR